MMCLPHCSYPSCKDIDDFAETTVVIGAENAYFGPKNTTTPFQLKIMLDTDNLVAVDSEKYLRNSKRRNFEDF